MSGGQHSNRACCKPAHATRQRCNKCGRERRFLLLLGKASNGRDGRVHTARAAAASSAGTHEKGGLSRPPCVVSLCGCHRDSACAAISAGLETRTEGVHRDGLTRVVGTIVPAASPSPSGPAHVVIGPAERISRVPGIARDMLDVVGVHALRRFGLRHCRSSQRERNKRGSAKKSEFRHALLT